MKATFGKLFTGVLFLLTVICCACFAAAESEVLTDGCTSIGPRAFADCPNLFYIRIPVSVTDIVPDAFDGCSHL